MNTFTLSTARATATALSTYLGYIWHHRSLASRFAVMIAVALFAMTVPALAKVILTVDVGRPSKSCTGFGICRITVDFLSERSVPADANLLDPTHLSLSFLAQSPEQGNVLVVEQPVVLDPSIAYRLGYQHVTVLPGTYTVNRSKNPLGDVNLNVDARGIVINITVGRPRHNCTGFGICSITIGAEMNPADRVVPAVPTLNNGVLDLNLLGTTPDHDDVLSIDDDMQLDAATSLALGYQQVTILKGDYPVDYSTNPNGHVQVNVATAGITIWVKFGRPSRNCAGFGICEISVELKLTTDPPTSASVDGNVLTLDLLSPSSEKGDVLPIEDDITLDAATSLALGYQQVTLLKGDYPVDYSTNPNGRVTVNVLARGISVTIYVGRRSRDCNGFGICDIVIDLKLSANAPNAVHGSVSVRDGKLVVDMLGATGSHDEMLPIDEDIVLDEATSLALGYQQVTLKKGMYPVDYSSNPNGHVEIPLATAGLTIHIKVGRQSKGCAGFGICEITVGFDLAMVPTSSSLNGNLLTIDMLAPNSQKGDVMTIDEDIVLDGATSRALGYQQVTVLKGDYPVDYSTNPNGRVTVNVLARGISVTIYVGRRSRDCNGFGICDIVIDLKLSADTPNAVHGSVSVRDGKLVVDMLGATGSHDEMLPIDEDIVLDKATSLALGYQQVTLKKGMYPVDYSSNPNGHVEIPLATAGLTIHIKVGRQSKGCAGFGICEITIDINLAMVPTSGSIQGDALTLDLLAPATEKGDVMTIDEDIVLDGATSRALGYQQVTVLKGDYPVDYSTNANGRVKVKVQTRGINVTITIGRASRDCAGFGICKITLGFSLESANQARALASVKNGQLVVDLLDSANQREEMLAIDADIVLDSATAEALGLAQLTIQKGLYEVDYSDNQYGMVQLTTTEPSSSVGKDQGAVAGRTSMDLTASPNPASQSATLSFETATSQVVTVTVVNAQGEEVARLVDGAMIESGRHRLNLDASSLPSGMYFYTVRSGATVATKALQIIK